MVLPEKHLKKQQTEHKGIYDIKRQIRRKSFFNVLSNSNTRNPDILWQQLHICFVYYTKQYYQLSSNWDN